MDKPLVTVVIAAYNYGRFIEEAINSVLSQDYPADRIEVLVVDDGSTDDTPERVKKYGSRIRYFRKPNGGQGSTFNLGFQNAHGDIVSLLDADDYWFPDKLSTVVEEFVKHPDVGVVYHPLREYHEQTGEFKDFPFTPISGFVPSNLKHVVVYDGVMTTSSFRRTVLQQLLPIPEVLRNQADGYLGNLAIFLAPVVAIDRPLAVYRIHGKNLYFKSGASAEAEHLRRRLETLRELPKCMTSWLISHGFDVKSQEIQTALLRWIILTERDEFQLSPPGRIRFFRHLLKSYRHTGPTMTPRIRLVNYMNACGALIVGHDKFHILDESREKVSRWLRYDNPLSSYFRRKIVRRHQFDR